MTFTAEMYDRIVRTLADEWAGAPEAASAGGPATPRPATPSPEPSRAAPPAQSAEGRGERRVNAHGGATAVVGGRPHPVRVRDVSRNGFGLLMVFPIEPGEQFAVSLAGAGAMSGLSIVCTTAYCRPAGHGLYSVGARLLRFSPKA